MNFEEYQLQARKTAFYPDRGMNLWYPALGLAGETGEVAEKVKKHYRDAGSFSELAASLTKELGDVLWYVSNLASELGISLDNIALMNIEKLQSRSDRGKLSGSGDDR